MRKQTETMWAVQCPKGGSRVGEWFTIAGTVAYYRKDAVHNFSPDKEDWARAKKVGYRVAKVQVVTAL